MIYGHGLMGSANQVASGSIRKTAIATCVVAVGTNWRGMSDLDLANVAQALNDLNRGREIFEVLVQGIINFIALEHIARGPMATGLFVDNDSKSLVDPSKVFYYGLSQGHIFGSTFLAYDPFVSRGVVGVGGANYSMMLERSADWPSYRIILEGAYNDPLDIALMIHFMQLGWDLTDPVGSANDLLTGKIPNTPKKQILIQMAMEDDEVPNIATEFQARTMGIPLLLPSVKTEIYGITEKEGPLENGLVIFDGGQPPTPLSNETPSESGAHYATRNEAAALRQIHHFFTNGEIINTCSESGCMCQSGGCD